MIDLSSVPAEHVSMQARGIIPMALCQHNNHDQLDKWHKIITVLFILIEHNVFPHCHCLVYTDGVRKLVEEVLLHPQVSKLICFQDISDPA